MKIPKYIEALLEKREKLAYQLIYCDFKLTKWLEQNGANFNDIDPGATNGGAMIYVEPTTAKEVVRNYIYKM